LIKQPNKQSPRYLAVSTKPQYTLGALLVIPLFGFFVYATIYQTSFFPPLAGALMISIIFLTAFDVKLNKKEAEINLIKQDFLEKTNLLNVEIDKTAHTITAFQRKIVDYSHLKDLTEKLCMCLSLSDTAQTLSTQVARFFEHPEMTVILYLFDQRRELAIVSSIRKNAPLNIKAKQGDVYDHWVVKSLKPLIIDDIKSDFRFDLEKINVDHEMRAIGSLMSVPLLIGDKAIGILRVDSPLDKQFSMEDLRLLTTIADLGAIAIENAQFYERIENLATHDSLTGLLLRRYLLERLAQEVSREMRLKRELSFLMIDLDNFKQYNDRFGHAAGDIVLRTVAMILAEMFNVPGNIVCRYGGEEFSVLLPDCSKEKAVELAQKFRQRIESQTILLRREETRITVSVGVATFPSDAQIKEDLIQQADLALYRAKKQGRNQVCSA
jgi:diguanylate cyclase (GGDEF)-like protein